MSSVTIATTEPTTEPIAVPDIPLAPASIKALKSANEVAAGRKGLTLKPIDLFGGIVSMLAGDPDSRLGTTRLNPADVHTAIVEHFSEVGSSTLNLRRPLTASTVVALNAAKVQAHKIGFQEVLPKHVLIASLDDDDVYTLLSSILGVDLRAVRQDLRHALYTDEVYAISVKLGEIMDSVKRSKLLVPPEDASASMALSEMFHSTAEHRTRMLLLSGVMPRSF